MRLRVAPFVAVERGGPPVEREPPGVVLVGHDLGARRRGAGEQGRKSGGEAERATRQQSTRCHVLRTVSARGLVDRKVGGPRASRGPAAAVWPAGPFRSAQTRAKIEPTLNEQIGLECLLGKRHRPPPSSIETEAAMLKRRVALLWHVLVVVARRGVGADPNELLGQLGVGRSAQPRAGVVQGRQVRDLLPLGRVRNGRVRERVVPAQHVQQGRQLGRVPAPARRSYGDPLGNWPYDKFINGANDKSGHFAQFAPKLCPSGGNWDPDAMGAALRRRGRAVRGAGRGAPRRVLHVGQQGQRVELGRRRARCSTWRRCTPHAFRKKGLKFLVAMHHAYHFTGYYQYVPTQTDAEPAEAVRPAGDGRRRTSSGSTS